MQALRFNQGKPMLSYILQFPNSLAAIARIMEFGAAKYFDGNWKSGGKPDDEYLNSMMRHLTAWVNGTAYDADSGCSHLGMAIWNLLALHQLNHPDEIMDADRFKEKCEYWKAKKESPDNARLQAVHEMLGNWPVEVQGKFGEHPCFQSEESADVS